jgi:hypothetical protein
MRCLRRRPLIGLLLTLILLRGDHSWTASFAAGHELRPFIGASLAIGILSPAATAFARQQIGATASWETAGAVQALWRSSEWITGHRRRPALCAFPAAHGGGDRCRGLKRELRGRQNRCWFRRWWRSPCSGCCCRRRWPCSTAPTCR